MKNKLFAILLCSVLLFAGCGKTATTKTSSSESSASVPVSSEAAASDAAVITDSVDSNFTYAEVPSSSETTKSASTLDEFVTLAEYKNIEITDADGVAEQGSTVNIDYAGTIDGVAFDGGTGNYNLVLGSGSFIPGFEDQLVGHKKGEVVDVVVTFPEDYGVDNLNGKEAHFKTTINEIYKQTPDTAINTVVQDSEVASYPKDMIEEWTTFFKSYYKADADANGMSVDAYMASLGVTQEQLDSNISTYAKTDLVLRAILEKEGITEDSEEYKKASENITTDYGQTSAAKLTEQLSAQNLDEKIIASYVGFYTRMQAAMNVLQKYSA